MWQCKRVTSIEKILGIKTWLHLWTWPVCSCLRRTTRFEKVWDIRMSFVFGCERRKSNSTKLDCNWCPSPKCMEWDVQFGLKRLRGAAAETCDGFCSTHGTKTCHITLVFIPKKTLERMRKRPRSRCYCCVCLLIPKEASKHTNENAARNGCG